MKKGDSIETISTLVDLYRAFTNTQGPPLVHSRLAARPVWSQSRPQAAPPPGRAAVGAWAVQLRLRALRRLRADLDPCAGQMLPSAPARPSALDDESMCPRTKRRERLFPAAEMNMYSYIYIYIYIYKDTHQPSGKP